MTSVGPFQLCYFTSNSNSDLFSMTISVKAGIRETMHVYEYVSFSLATIFLMCPFWWFKMKSQLITLSKALWMSEQEI